MVSIYLKSAFAIILLLASQCVFGQIPVGGKAMNTSFAPSNVASYTNEGVDELTVITVVGQPFTNGLRLVVGATVTNSFDSQIKFPSVFGIEANDSVLVAFYARTISTEDVSGKGKLNVIIENNTTLAKDLSQEINIGTVWTQYFTWVKCVSTLKTSEVSYAFHVGFPSQTIEIADVKFINYKNTPPSCVITTPHTNAYFQQGSEVVIKVYASAIGGHFSGGNVTKVEFFNGDSKLGEATIGTSNTYAFVWANVPPGIHTITAKATDRKGSVAKSAGVVITVSTASETPIGLSAGKGKYLANIVSNSVRADYNTYWNGVTAENSCKWVSIERNRDVMVWTQADIAYNHAKNNHLMFRYHALAWGSQYPDWITTLTPAEFQEEMEEYMAAVAARYPLIDQIDVLNENMYLNTWNGQEHAPGTPYFRAGLGGPGETGYDWVIWLFEKARHYFPNSKLIMNDFELEGNTAGINEMLNVVKVLRDRNLIDGFGTQAHYFNLDGKSATVITNALNLMANSGVPVYVTELDLRGSPTSEANQRTSYSNLFPVYWNHPAVAGITLWGYIEGATWATGTGILNSNGTERSSMTWLKTYMEGRPDVGYPFGNIGTTYSDDNILTNWEFDTDTYLWSIASSGTGSGTMEVVSDAGMSGDNALRICVSSGGSLTRNVQVFQNAPFVAGNRYEVSFIAKADAPREIALVMQKAGIATSPIYLNEIVQLSTDKQTFKFSFNPVVTDATNLLKFFVGLNSNCLTIDSVVFKKVNTTSIKLVEKSQAITVYPNPNSTGKVSVINNTDEVINTIEFIDMFGKVVKIVNPNQSRCEIEITELPKGLYLLNVRSESTNSTNKLVVQ